MIDEALFYGGSKHVAAGSVANILWRGSPRVVVVEAGSTGTDIRMFETYPTPGGFGGLFDEAGGPHFIIINRSGRTLNLAAPDGSYTFGSPIPTGKSGFIMLNGNGPPVEDQWSVIVRDAPDNTHYVGTRSDPLDFEATYPKVYNDPACLEDCVDFLDLGPSGIVVPMFMNSAATFNQNHEPIRGADVQLPNELGIAFERGQFVEDPNHPNFTTLSQDLKDALFGVEGADPVLKWHILTYGSQIDGNSRHWHHIRWSGVMGTPISYGWGMPAPFSVIRHYWTKTLTYTRQSDNREFDIEIRVVMEHTVNPEPVAGDTPASGTNNATQGAWGTLFNIYVFAEEAAPQFDDAETFQPNGWSAAIAFSKNDPAVWGGLYTGSGGTQAHKVTDPRMIICASIPTTMESPVGFLWHNPSEDRVHYCSQRSAGIPWTNPSIAATHGTSQWNNGVFGDTISGFDHGCMTLGGDVPLSIPMDWVIVENPESQSTPGEGSGHVFMYCLKPGWDEVEGVLDLAGGTAIKLCILPQEEDQNPANICLGHEDEPFMGIGGTHRCFLSTAEGCCIGIVTVDENGNDVPSSSQMRLVQSCTRQTIVYGDFNGFDCTIEESKCDNLGSFTTSYALTCVDYTYMMDGNQLLRSIRFSDWFDDPTQAKYDFDYLSSSPDIKQRVGTATLGASTITVASVTGATYSNVTTYFPSGATFSDAMVDCTVPLSASYTAGLVLRGSVSFGALTGYTVIFDKTNDHVSIYKVASGTETLLARQTVAGISALSSIAAEFECEGSTLTARWGAFTLEAEDCTNTTGGEPGVVTRGSSVGAVFTPDATKWIDDRSIYWLEVYSTFDVGSCSSGSFQNVLLDGYGRCEEESANAVICASDSEHCNCTVWGNNRIDPTLPSGCVETSTLSFGGMPAAMVNSCFTQDPCSPGAPNCGDCPPPRLVASITMPPCVHPQTEATVTTADPPEYCGGSERWNAAIVACL